MIEVSKVNQSVRVSQIDFLRAIAIFMVLFRHHESVDYLQHIGWAGVDLFFVLSGFLVTSLIFKEYKLTGAFSAKNFLIRRGFKIYPLFYFFVIVSLCFLWLASALAGYVKEHLVEKTIIEIFFLQNYQEGLWAHTWSLAVEEHFYFGIAAIIYIIVRFKPDWMKFIPFLFVGLLLLVLLFRWAHLQSHPQIDLLTHVYPTHLRFDSLLFGSLIAYLYLFNEGFIRFFSSRKLRLIFVIVALTSLYMTLNQSVVSDLMVSVGFSVLYFGFGAILIAILYEGKFFRSMERFFGYRFIVSVGQDSYAIYLFHMFLPSIFDNVAYFQTVDYRIRFVLYLFSSLACGKIMARLIEQPMLRVRDHIFPAKAKAI